MSRILVVDDEPTLVATVKFNLENEGYDPLRVDLLRREATRKGEPPSLKPKEFDLLVCLMRNRGRLLTRGQLIEMVWHYDGFDQTRTVDVHIGRLREKIEERPASPAWIITVRGSGYRFAG